MSITKKIVDMMGGSIDVVSAPNQGTEFIIHLKLKIQDTSANLTNLDALQNARALVVASDYNACSSATNLLRRLGMRAEWTMYGREAVLRAKEAVDRHECYSVIILDDLLLDMESIDLHAEEFPLFAFLKIASASAQFLAHAVVTVYAFMNKRRGIDRQFDAFAQRTYSADVIGVVMRDEHAANVLEIQTHLAQTLLYLTSRDAGINQHPLFTRSEVVTIAATTACKTSEYELVVCHC
jgi:hypothetical protein